MAEQNPNKVYEVSETYGEARYLHAGEPGCLLGHALVALGVPDYIIMNYEGLDITEIIGKEVSVDSNFDFADTDWICKAQQEQDRGTPWGDAVRNADEYIANLPRESWM